MGSQPLGSQKKSTELLIRENEISVKGKRGESCGKKETVHWKVVRSVNSLVRPDYSMRKGKSCSKKEIQHCSFSQKTDFSSGISDFWLKPFLVHFFTKIRLTFLKSVGNNGFCDSPLAIFEEKKFSSPRRDKEYFLRT